MNLRNRICVAFPLMVTSPAAQAQQWLVNNAINNQIVETAICDSALKKGEKLPSICAKYPKYSRAARPSNPTTQTPQPQAPASAKSRVAGSGKFVPNPGDDSLRKLADSVGSTEQERQQLRQVVQAGNTLFEQKYGAKGWKNDLAGAFAFFIVSISTVYNDQEPDGAAQDRVFDALGTTLVQAPDIAKLSNKDRNALYNTLIAAGGLPLLFYADGKQQNNAAEVEQAKAMAAEFSRKILNTEPQALAAIGQ